MVSGSSAGGGGSVSTGGAGGSGIESVGGTAGSLDIGDGSSKGSGVGAGVGSAGAGASGEEKGEAGGTVGSIGGGGGGWLSSGPFGCSGSFSIADSNGDFSVAPSIFAVSWDDASGASDFG